MNGGGEAPLPGVLAMTTVFFPTYMQAQAGPILWGVGVGAVGGWRRGEMADGATGGGGVGADAGDDVATAVAAGAATALATAGRRGGSVLST